MNPNPDALLVQGVLRRGLATLQRLQEIGVPIDRSLLDLLEEQGVADRGTLQQILDEELATAGKEQLPPDVLAAIGRPDARLGRYVRVEIIGQGGSAVVWKAWDLETHRMVALKMLAPPGSTPTRYSLREAKVATELIHPNIVPAFEIGHASDAYGKECHYLAMAWIDGVTLDRQVFPIDDALRFMRDVALAVQAAHDRGIIHRDIKPGNIIIDKEGRCYIMDFGLAKPVEGMLDTATRTGLVVGTPSYMPPEQALGLNQDLTPQSDVYGLGATLYGLVTGRAPFDGENPVETCIKVIREPLTPPRQVIPGVPEDVERIILRAMAKDRNHRYRTARAYAEEIDRWLERKPILGEDELTFEQALAVLGEGRLEESIQLFRELKRLGRGREGGTIKVMRERLARDLVNAARGVPRGALHLATAVLCFLEKEPAHDPCAQACADFREAVGADREAAEAHLGLGIALTLQARFPGEEGNLEKLLDEAIEHFGPVTKSPPLRATALHNRGIAKFYLARKGGAKKKTLLHAAIADFSIAVGADPSFAYALKDLGVAKMSLSNVDAGRPQAAPISEAVQHFTRALEIKPDLEGALYERGRAYYALARYAEAVDDWRSCASLSSSRAKHVEPMIKDAESKMKR